MKKHICNLIIVSVMLLLSCEPNAHTNNHSVNWYMNNTEPMKQAWLKSDTIFFKNFIKKLEKETNKNSFYSNLTDFYALSNRVIIAFDDSCQGEKHFIFNDLIIDSSKEKMNKLNVINGLKTYMKSKLLFHCNLNSDTLEHILNIKWKKCDIMNEKDLESLLLSYNTYAKNLPKCDTCSVTVMDSTISYNICY